MQALFCKSDAAAQSCVTALNETACGSSAPYECTNFYDTAPAIQLCQQVSNKYCAVAAKCGVATTDSCLSQVNSVLQCSTAVGASPTINTCLSALDALTCTANSTPQLPSSCTGVIKVRTESNIEVPGLNVSAINLSDIMKAASVSEHVY